MKFVKLLFDRFFGPGSKLFSKELPLAGTKPAKLIKNSKSELKKNQLPKVKIFKTPLLAERENLVTNIRTFLKTGILDSKIDVGYAYELKRAFHFASKITPNSPKNQISINDLKKSLYIVGDLCNETSTLSSIDKLAEIRFILKYKQGLNPKEVEKRMGEMLEFRKETNKYQQNMLIFIQKHNLTPLIFDKPFKVISAIPSTNKIIASTLTSKSFIAVTPHKGLQAAMPPVIKTNNKQRTGVRMA